MVKEKIEETTKVKIRTLLILFFPSIVIALIPCSSEPGFWSALVPLSIKALLVFYQFVVIKNFIDTHYGD